MKVFFFLFLSFNLFCQHADTVLINFQGNHFYHIKGEDHFKILIYLHGGVGNSIYEDTLKNPALNELLESNSEYIKTALVNNYDVLIPIKNNNFNWLTNHSFCYQTIKSYLDSLSIYDLKYISGFSDGGTGSFKIFYDYSDCFEGLIIFNGYPQHSNFYLTVDYSKVIAKKVVYFSSKKDKRIPYEFSLTEYLKQKKSNPNTYFYLTNGNHSFKQYSSPEMSFLFDVLSSKINNISNDQTQGLIVNDQLIEHYPFRNKIARKYNYGKEYLKE